MNAAPPFNERAKKNEIHELLLLHFCATVKYEPN